MSLNITVDSTLLFSQSLDEPYFEYFYFERYSLEAKGSHSSLFSQLHAEGLPD
jgi:hypothetical protein